MGKLNLYYGTVRSATENRHVMAWAKSREDALDLVEAAMTTDEPVLGSVVGPLTSLPDDIMNPGVFVEATAVPKS
jgi:hypothetical protein